MLDSFTFITPFFQRHGIGYLDVILQTMDKDHEQLSSDGYVPNEHDQYKAHSSTLKKGKLTQLNAAFYLLPKEYKRENGEAHRWKEFISDEKIKLIENSIDKTSSANEQSKTDLKKLKRYLIEEGGSFPNYAWLKNEWQELPDLWHIINEFSLYTQVEWYKDHSTLYQMNEGKVQFIEIDIKYEDLENEYAVTAALKKWVQEQHFDSHTYINLWGTATALQLAWYYLAWSSPNLKPTKFVKCKTVKQHKDKTRFTPLIIEHADKSLLTSLETSSHQLTGLSEEQQEAFYWLQEYKDYGDQFTILLLGDRGIGKTRVVEKVFNDQIISINCAQFKSNPDLARSELFGHKKGSFTGATNDKKGAFKSADNNVLFLDEVHHLDKATQAMLLTALQTDKNGFFTFTPLGADKPNKVKFQLIVASNAKPEKLNELILPDLLDRISQRIIQFESLLTGESIVKHFNSVWEEMKFTRVPYHPLSKNMDKKFTKPEFHDWLVNKTHSFEGNYRDLERIAILCADYQRSCHNTKLITSQLSMVEYIEKKLNWNIPPTRKEITIEHFLDEHNHISLEEIVNEFKAKIVRSAEMLCGDQKSAAKMLGITPKAIIGIKKREKTA